QQKVLNKVINRNYFEKLGLNTTIIGYNVATMIASIIDGSTSTTYSKNIGVIAIASIYVIYIIGDAAVIAIVLAFIRKFTAVISSI
ncbi:solute carrier family 23 protein, partial [Staphylococcus aureus]